jgi:acyl-CoA reductase-like NAD-dependent aldehyde dehydrogenase
MKDCRQFYIEGAWVRPAGGHEISVINPATEESIARMKDLA